MTTPLDCETAALVKDDRAPWWPLLPLVPAVGALIVAIDGLDDAQPYVQDIPCITGWMSRGRASSRCSMRSG